jgi:hypothetical protein
MNREQERDNEKIINSACKLITDNLGATTAGQYRKFYQDKSEEVIKISIRELLTELVGPENMKKQIEGIAELN